MADQTTPPAVTNTEPVVTSTVPNNPPPSTTITTTPITFAGMSTYTDSKLKFSFWYPSSWTLKEEAVKSPDADGKFQDGTIVKQLSVTARAAVDGEVRGVTIQEFYSPTGLLTEHAENAGGPDMVDQTYYFDTKTQAWMYKNLTATPERPVGTVTKADISHMTMGGLPIFMGLERFGADTLVALDSHNFLIISTNEPGGLTEQDYLVKTVVSTYPTVMTPVSAAEQIRIIQQEAVLYGVIGKAIDGGQWYVDSQYVYDYFGNVVVGANPSTFVPLKRFSDGSKIDQSAFMTDGKYVYYRGATAAMILPEADPKTFVMIRQKYEIPYATSSGKYGQTFTSYDTSYEKDAMHVWDGTRLIPGVDVKTFVVTGDTLTRNAAGISTIAHDAHHVYGRDSEYMVTIDGVVVPGQGK